MNAEAATLALHHFYYFRLHFLRGLEGLVHQTIRISKDKATMRFEDYYPHVFKVCCIFIRCNFNQNAMKNQLALLALASLLLLDACTTAPTRTTEVPIPVSPWRRLKQSRPSCSSQPAGIH